MYNRRPLRLNEIPHVISTYECKVLSFFQYFFSMLKKFLLLEMAFYINIFELPHLYNAEKYKLKDIT